MPHHVVRRVAEALNNEKKPVNGSRILLVGLSYKANVDDDRESPTYVLMDLLKERGAEIAYYDPFVPVIRMTREHGHWAGTKSISWDKNLIAGYDAVLISTAHDAVNYKELGNWAKVIVDTRNIMTQVPSPTARVYKA